MSTQEIIAQVVATELAKHTEVYLNTNLLGVLIKEVINDCQNAVEDDFSERGLEYDHDTDVEDEVEKQLDARHVVMLEKHGNCKPLGWFVNHADAERFKNLIEEDNALTRYYIHS